MATQEPDSNEINVKSLLTSFGMIGISSFGGGRQAYFRHTFIQKKKWLDDKQFLEGLTLSQILPGPTVANLSVYLGQRFYGISGAVVAGAAMVLPGALMILVLAILFLNRGSVPYVKPLFHGIGAAAVGLALANTIQVGRRGLESYRDLLFTAATFAAIIFLKVPLLVAVLVLAPISIALYLPANLISKIKNQIAR